MNNEQSPDLGARRRERLVNALSAELTALEDLLAHYRFFSRLRSKLWHATLKSDHAAIEEYEPQFQSAQSAYRQARLRFGEALITTRIAARALALSTTEQGRSQQEAHQPDKLPNDRSEGPSQLIHPAVDIQPDFMIGANRRVNESKVERPLGFIYVNVPNPFDAVERPALDGSTTAALEQFAADVERLAAQRGLRNAPKSKDSN